MDPLAIKSVCSIGIWRQGDFLVINPTTKGIIIQGRSDSVLNPSGVRFRSGEIYTVLDQFSSVIDNLICIGQRRPQDLDERVLLFVMREGTKLDKGLDEAIRNAIKKGLSARHVYFPSERHPGMLHFVSRFGMVLMGFLPCSIQSMARRYRSRSSRLCLGQI